MAAEAQRTAQTTSPQTDAAALARRQPLAHRQHQRANSQLRGYFPLMSICARRSWTVLSGLARKISTLEGTRIPMDSTSE